MFHCSTGRFLHLTVPVVVLGCLIQIWISLQILPAKKDGFDFFGGNRWSFSGRFKQPPSHLGSKKKDGDHFSKLQNAFLSQTQAPKFHVPFPKKKSKLQSSCGFVPQAISFHQPQEQNQVDLVEAARWKSPNHPRWATGHIWEDGTTAWCFRNPVKLTSWYGESTHFLQGFLEGWWLFGISCRMVLVDWYFWTEYYPKD